jgi:hypothetical protein
MKNLLKILSLLILVITGISSNAQTKFMNRNNDERMSNRIVTTNNAYTNIDSVTIANNEIGILQVTMIGYAKDTAYGVTGIKQCRYNKRGGTLTMGTVTDLLTTVVDADLDGATFDLNSSNGKIYIRVKGLTDIPFTWTCLVKRKSVTTVL